MGLYGAGAGKFMIFGACSGAGTGHLSSYVAGAGAGQYWIVGAGAGAGLDAGFRLLLNISHF